MTDFVYSGGVRFDDAAVADVTMDKDGHPLTCKNPITGEEISGGGSSNFSTAEVQFNFANAGPSAKITFAEIIDAEPPEKFNIFFRTSINDFALAPHTIPLYKGCAIINWDVFGDNVAEVSASGDAEVNADEEFIKITGDCEISVTFTKIS